MNTSTLTEPQQASPEQPVFTDADSELEQLRAVLLGKDYQELLVLKQLFDNPQQYSEQIAAVISEALAVRAAQDNSLGGVLSPTIEHALTDSIARDPQRLANALYPVMGPAIRKSINEVLTQTFDTFNQLLEQSLSPKSLRWRFDAWRSGRDYAEVVLLNTLEYQVEQVFLIHTGTGLLLRHVLSAQAISKDPDMISGMLTAIQDFVADSFAVEGGDALQNMRFGALNVVIEQGPYAVIAAVVRGNLPTELPGLLRDTQEDIHRQMHHTLRSYTGDSTPFVRVQPLLEQCLLTRVQQAGQHKRSERSKRTKNKKRKFAFWPLYVLLACVVSSLLYHSYQSQQRAAISLQAERDALAAEREWLRLLAVFNNEPGMVILQAKRAGNKRLIRGLLDPNARRPQALLDAFNRSHPPRQGDETVLEFKPYLSGAPAFSTQH